MNDYSTFTDTLQPGIHAPLGSQVQNGGVNFAVFSEHATRMTLCIFDERGETELRRYDLHGPHDGIFHGFLAGAAAGLIYALRAHGPYEPDAGHRFNPNKLLLDPYAREIVGDFSWRDEHHGYQAEQADAANTFDTRDNGRHALKARVASAAAPLPSNGSATRRASGDIVLYEVHVKGFSMTHPDIPPEIRGSYSALAHPAAVAHFKALGVTTLSLLPVQYWLDEPHLAKIGLRNYWGYNTLGFFAPNPRLSLTPDDPTQVNAEFRAMVSALHLHGMEVVLDVVYNHTAEGNELGPTLSFRGLDNASWYRLVRDDKRHYENHSGCGNTLNLAHPRVTQFVLDSLRYWVTEMGVDGFRFDLAPILGRTHHSYDQHAAFFTALRQDPTLATVHLIAEPWDAGHLGYQLGRFPGRFLEWNDKFRDSVRSYWLLKNVTRGELARRFTASSDIFHHGQRQPAASVNFISAHDGFTLADSVSYDRKHNERNGEQNRDGRDNELSCNFGTEGETNDASIAALRDRVRRAMISTLIFAQGTPMVCAGDEIGKSQHGNNNAYCQDNEIGWLKWQTADHAMRDFVTRAIALRHHHALLHHNEWFARETEKNHLASVTWFVPDGHQMQIKDWHDHDHHAFACVLSQKPEKKSAGAEKLMICFNPEQQPNVFRFSDRKWQLIFDSSGEIDERMTPGPDSTFVMPPVALAIFSIMY
ncbi:MAG: glycogen debranching protein GlgX [Burkholderiales bacterium]